MSTVIRRCRALIRFTFNVREADINFIVDVAIRVFRDNYNSSCIRRRYLTIFQKNGDDEARYRWIKSCSYKRDWRRNARGGGRFAREHNISDVYRKRDKKKCLRSSARSTQFYRSRFTCSSRVLLAELHTKGPEPGVGSSRDSFG